MKLNKFIALLAVIGLSYGSAFAANSTNRSATAAATNNFLTSGARIHSFVIANDVAQPLVVKFFDAPSTSLTYTNPAYTNYLSYTTNIVTTYITYSGVTNSHTNSGIYTYSSTVAAATNSYRTIVSISVPASETVTYTPTDGTLVSFGLLATNNTNCTITINYSPAL